MQSFIDKITDKIVQSSVQLNDWVIIVPSQRAIKYLHQSLFKHYQKSIISPTIITIHQFIDEVSPKIILDKTRLLFRLYQVYLKQSKDKSSFDEFYTWGKIVLSDFDEIENYIVDGKDLFKNLKDIKGIENWSFNSEELTPTQLKFMEFWEELGGYYEEFKAELAKVNETYHGKATREIAENIELIFNKYPTQQFLFAGFNAHSEAELQIMNQLLKRKRAEILYDGDLYYVQEKKGHEAGAFIQRNLADLGLKVSEQNFDDVLKNKELSIELIGCAQATGQVKTAATILSQLSKEEIDETLVLLADENLLVPLLKNIPKSVGEANITLGLSLNNSVLKSWFEILFRVQKGLEKSSSAYHKDIFEICFHPFVNEILNQDELHQLTKFEKDFKKRNIIYASPEKLQLPNKLKAIVLLIYTKWSADWKNAISTIRQINALLYEGLKEENQYEKSLLETFDKGIIDLINCLSEDAPAMSLMTFKNLFTEHYSRLKISYFGNPLKGLQITGLLETRMLDFKRIICIGMNEKNMPPNNQVNSMIPMDLRRHHSMPTVREKQGLFAHHFYRLLHHAEELYITYSNQQEGLNSFEKSRYIMQLELELATSNPNIKIQYKDYMIRNQEAKLEKVNFKLDENNRDLIVRYLQHGASASGIKNFYNCELDFFYKYILKYRDEQKVEEDIDSSTFGVLIHNTLEAMYQQYANKQLEGKKEKLIAFRESDLEEMKKAASYELGKQFGLFFNNDEVFKEGKNRLNFEMAHQLMINFFAYERQKLREVGGVIYVEDLEHRLELEVEEIPLKSSVNEQPIRLKGFIDRIDYYDGGFHIIDYKSGKVDVSKDLMIKDSDLNADGIYNACVKKKYFIQFYFYLYLFYQKHHTYPKSITFVPFINTKDTQPIYDENNRFEILVREFPNVMNRIVAEMLEGEKTIEHNPKSQYCDFCK